MRLTFLDWLCLDSSEHRSVVCVESARPLVLKFVPGSTVSFVAICCDGL